MSFATEGEVQVRAGAAVAVGDALTADAQGRAVPTTTAGDAIIGHAIWAASGAGEICTARIAPGFYS